MNRRRFLANSTCAAAALTRPVLAATSRKLPATLQEDPATLYWL